MSNLFKKGFASLALASAMASSVFAGDAAYIDVKVNYLSGTGKAVLGYDSWDDNKNKYKAGARKDLVELYIRVLDKDGNLADKDKDSDQLLKMVLTRSGKTTNAENLRNSDTVGNSVADAATATHTISRSVVSNKNVARYTLDYTNQRASSAMDNLVIKAGALIKSITIQLDTVDATSLLVRATTQTSIDASWSNGSAYINSAFANIRLLGDSNHSGGTGNLSVQSHSIPQITAGQSVPLRIFASTGANTDTTTGADTGRFTKAPNLKDAKIIVIAVGDYSDAPNGTADVYLGQTELTMIDGIASGSMVINYGLPERITTATDIASGHENFDKSKKSGGLGVAFIAYVKDESTINNHSALRFSKGVLKTGGSIFTIGGDNLSTDAIKVKSGDPVGFTGGVFDNTPNRSLASKLWTKNKTDVYVANDKGNGDAINSDQKITITAVDKLGNPAILGTSLTGTAVLDATFKVNGNTPSIVAADQHFIISNSGKMTTAGNFGLTSGIIQVLDGAQNVARSSEITASYGDGSLAGLTPFKFNVHTIDLVGNTPSDIIGDLKKLVTVSVGNNATKADYVIRTDESTKTDFDKIKVVIKVKSAKTDGNFSTAFLVKAFNRKGEVDEGIFFNGVPSTKAGGGATVFMDNNNSDINMTTDSTSWKKGKNNIASFDIARTDATANTNAFTDVIGTSTTFILKGKGAGDTNVTYRKFIDAYVATSTTTEKAKDFVGSDSKPGKPGKTIIDFDFSGSLVEQFVGKAQAIITFGTDETDKEGNLTKEAYANFDIHVGVVGQPFVSANTIEATANTNIIKAIIPESGRLSVVLYGTDANGSNNFDVNKTQHSIKSITINGFTPVYTSIDGNKLTDAVDIDIAESNNSKAGHKKVTIAVGDIDTATKVNIAGYNFSDSAGEGSELKKFNSLPANLIDPSDLGGKPTAFGTSPISTRSAVPVFTNTYYALFDSIDNLTILDAYGNKVYMKSTDLKKNYVLSVSDTECAEAEMANGDSDSDEAKPGYIYFKPCAAGKKIDLIITASGSEKAKNTITFTNIVKKVENKAFMVSLNVGDADYNIVNNDVVVKVTPDGGTERSETILTITSDNKDAKVKVVPVELLTGREFGTMIGSGTTLKATINAKSSYFVVTSDKPGKITVKVDATIPSTESVSGEEVPLTGTVSFTMVNVDTSAPTVTATSTSSSITITVKDDGLDAKATTVKVNDMSGKEVAIAKHTSGGVYVASDLKQGTYSVDVYAMDLSGNIHKQIIVQNVGAGSGSMTVEEEATAMLLATKEYEVAGTFTKHNFGDNSAKNWVYTQKSDGKSYQLLGDAPSEKDVFGWKETDIKVGAATWYMIRTGKGRFDWVLSNTSGVTYKLKGAKSDGSFNFSGRLNLNTSYKDGMLTFTASK